METTSPRSAVRVHSSDSFTVTMPTAGTRRGGRPTRGRGRATPSTDDLLLQALESQDFEVVEELEIRPQQRRGLRAAGAEREDVTVELDVSDDEDGVLLVEQDGMYTWHWPEHSAAPRSGARRGARRGLGGRQVTFRIEFYGETDKALARGARRGSRRGFFKGFLLGKVKAFVLKFVGRQVVKGVTKFIERNVRPGLVSMPAFDPDAWTHVDEGGTIDLGGSTGRDRRLLLFIHGTFSSTVGGYGALGATPWGRNFFDAALADYDAVIGYDHRSLSEDPLQNAKALYQTLRTLGDGHGLALDVVTHSRGGLVFRSLTETVLPSAGWKPTVERAVFVGVPNQGTTLAEPANWHTFIDLYTNLAVAVCRAIGTFPQVTFAAQVMREVIQGLGDLVKYMATEAVERHRIPGLSAMQPGGRFIKQLNETQPGQPRPEAARYYAITSTFDVGLLDGLGSGEESVLKQLPKRFLQVVVTKVADQLLGRSCDLVVNTDSMQAIDPGVGGFVKDVLDFGVNPHVYHTNYFVRPEVIGQLATWFGMAVDTLEPRRRGGRSARSLPSLEALAERAASA